jgi:hypothetical protein
VVDDAYLLAAEHGHLKVSNKFVFQVTKVIYEFDVVKLRVGNCFRMFLSPTQSSPLPLSLSNPCPLFPPCDLSLLVPPLSRPPLTFYPTSLPFLIIDCLAFSLSIHPCFAAPSSTSLSLLLPQLPHLLLSHLLARSFPGSELPS